MLSKVGAVVPAAQDHDDNNSDDDLSLGLSAFSISGSQTGAGEGQDALDGYEADTETELFTTHFEKHVKKSAERRTCDNTISQINRRLDSLARVLEQKSTCVAVVYDETSKRILITSNSIQPSALGKENPKEDIRNIQTAMKLLADHSMSVEDVIDGLATILNHYIRRNETIRRTLSVHEKKHANRQMPKVIKLLIKDMFRSGFETKTWKEIFDMNQLCKQHKTQINLATRILLTTREDISNTIINDVSRITRDFVKLRNSLASLSGCGVYKVLGVPDGTHAEMGMMDNLPVAAPHVKSPYIGLSRLCCVGCGLGVAISGASVRGKHGQAFNSNIPAFILHDPVKLEAFLGKDAYAEYLRLGKIGRSEDAIAQAQTIKGLTGRVDIDKNPRKMMADSSSSDVGLGVSDSDDELKDMLDDIVLKDVQLLQKLKHEYNDEFEILKSIGISKSEILEMYGESSNRLMLEDFQLLRTIEDYYKCEFKNLKSMGLSIKEILDLYRESKKKFEDLASDDIAALFSDEDVDVSFDDLSALYDDADDDPIDKAIFEAITNTESHEVIRDCGFDKFCSMYRAEYLKLSDLDDELDLESQDEDIVGIIRAKLLKEDGAESCGNNSSITSSGNESDDDYDASSNQSDV